MSQQRSEPSRTLIGPVYLIAGLLVVLPMIDLAINVWPVQFGRVEWRFGTVGLLSAYLLTPVIGVTFLILFADWLDHSAVRRVGAIVCVAFAAILVLLVPLFVLDWIQVRVQAPLEARPGIDVGSVRTVLKQLIIAAAVGWLGVAGLRQRGTAARARTSRRTTPLVRSAERPAE